MRRSGAPLLAALLLAVALVGAALSPACAQESPQRRIDGWNATLDQIAATLRRPSLAEADLAALRANAQHVYDDARALASTLQPEIAASQARVRSLAPPPTAPDAPGAAPPPPADEIEPVTAERTREEQHLAELTGMARQADVAALRAEQVLDAIADRRSQYFTTRLFERSPSILSPILWGNVIADLPGVATRLGRLFGDWFGLIHSRADRATGLLLLVVAFLVPASFWLARRFLQRVTDRPADADSPTDGQKVTAATWIVIVNVVVPILFIFLTGALLDAFGFLPPRMRQALNGVMVAVVAFTLLNGLAIAILAPIRSNWRLAMLDDGTAQRLYGYLLIAAVLVAAIPIVERLASITAADPSDALAINGAIALAIAVIVLLAARTSSRDGEVQGEAGSRIWRWVIALAGLAAVIAIAVGVFGYIALSSFLTSQIAWVGIVLALLMLLSRLVDLAVSLAFSPDLAVGRGLMASLGLGRSGLGQLGVIVGGLVRLLLVVLAVVAVAAPWGFDSVSLADSVRGLFYGVTIGTITITFSSIVAAIIVFVIGIVVTRVVQAWLDSKLLPTTNLDPGLRMSIRTGIGYLGVLLAAVLAGTYAGLNLANLAIVAGALSVGIGFGLQSIVNNFVSGLILLAERPIRAGDWIAVGGDEGTVRRINVRSTEIETFDRATVIIPNSLLITGTVKNMVLRDRSGRISIPVSVGYNADPAVVRDLLLDCARSHSKVLGFPEPEALLVNFGAASLDFELRCYLAEVSEGLRVRSDLRFAILEKIREEDIERPTALPAIPDPSYRPPPDT